MRRAAATWGMLLAVIATARIGAAQGNAASRPAEQLFYDGLGALHQHEYEKARVDFERSLAIAPRGSVLLNLAKAEWALGRHVDALKHLRAALGRPDLPAENRESATRGLDRWYAATGHILVNTDEGASVRIDGVDVGGTAPLPGAVDVEPGPRVVEAGLGDLAGRAEIVASAGVVVAANVWVARPAPPSATLAAPPQSATSPPILSAETVVGSHTQAAEPRSFWTGPRTVGTAVAALGMASLVVGGVAFVLASNDGNAARSATQGLGPSACGGAVRPDACTAQDAAKSAQSTDAMVSRVSLGVGAAAIVVGAAVALWPWSPSRRLSVSGALTPSGGGLAVRGRF